MKLSENWLREWVDLDIDCHDLAVQLTNLGLEVDSVVPAAADFTEVVVGEIVSAVPHPNADRLRCCTVNVGGVESLNIVCGGVNARAGIKVAVAIVGALLPGNFEIKAVKIRGEASAGMICSAKELGLDNVDSVAGGILELPLDATIGMSFRDYFDLNDHVIDIELTPNRGDCASIMGLARELSVFNKVGLSVPYFEPSKPDGSSPLNIKHITKKACPRYTGRLIRDVNMQAATPLWMMEKLRRSGLRSINPVVDVMNYVMLEYGQPLHAFDFDCLQGDLVVRMANSDESMTLLDGSVISLDKDSLVIADSRGPLALAGIMGGSDSAVSEKTQHVFLESAFFEPIGLRRTSAQFNIKTDSSYRFERGVDYGLQIQALERATALLVSIVGGSVGPITELFDQDSMPKPLTVVLRHEQINRILGMEVSIVEASSILTSLGFALLNENAPWHFRVPSFRFDVEQEIDLIEEIARVIGYQQIPSTNFVSPSAIVSVSEDRVSMPAMNQTLIARGYNEAVTYSFVDPEWHAFFIEDDVEPLTIENPIAQELSQMRTSIWPSLLGVMQYNLNRQQDRVRLFEWGRVFLRQDQQIEQPLKLAMLAVGDDAPTNWRDAAKPADFFSMKADIDMLLLQTADKSSYQWQACSHVALHPGQSAGLFYQGKQVGWLGVLHPEVKLKLGLKVAPVLCELDGDHILLAKLPCYQPISKFPQVKRDLAIVVDQTVPAGDIHRFISESSANLVSKVEIFDIYQGQGIESGQKSVALGLTFFDPSRTLIDSEVDDAFNKIVHDLQCQFNATMRS